MSSSSHLTTRIFHAEVLPGDVYVYDAYTCNLITIISSVGDESQHEIIFLRDGKLSQGTFSQFFLIDVTNVIRKI